MDEKDFKDVQELFNSFQTFRKTRQNWRDIINREDFIDLGDLYNDVGLRFHSFRPQHELNQYTAVLDTASTTFSVHARTDRSEDAENAQTWEHWLNASVIGMDIGKSSPLRLSRSWRTAIGAGVWELGLRQEWLKLPAETDVNYRERMKKDRENKLKLGLPFIWTSPNPMTMAWFEDDNGIPLVVKQSKRKVNPILAEFRLDYANGDFRKLGPDEEVNWATSGWVKSVDFTQVSTPDTIAYFIGNPDGKQKTHLIKQYDNRKLWGKPPYVIIPGLLQADTSDPDRRYIPLILGALINAGYDNFAESIVLLAAYLTGTPVYDVITKQGNLALNPETNQPLKVEIKPGNPSVIPLPPGAELKQRTITMSSDLTAFRQRMIAEGEKYGFPSGLAGETPEARTPAYALAEAAGRAMLFIDPAVKAEERAFAEMADLLGFCIKNYIGEEVPVLARVEDEQGKAATKTISIKPEQIGEFDVKVGVTVPSTSLQLAKQEMMRKDVDAGYLSADTYMDEGIGIKDIVREKRLIRRGKLEKMLEPSVLTHTIQLAQKEIEKKMPGAPPVPPIVPQGGGPAPTGPTRPAQQVRPVESQPNPILQGVP